MPCIRYVARSVKIPNTSRAAQNDDITIGFEPKKRHKFLNGIVHLHLHFVHYPIKSKFYLLFYHGQSLEG